MNDQPVHDKFHWLMLAVFFSLACALADLSAPSATPPAFPTVVLSSSASTFDHNTLVGQTAPAFSLPDVNNQPYTYAPTDGHKHVIIFYMAYT